MTAENVFTICTALVLITLILSGLSYCQNNDRLIAEALKSGVDPFTIQCAFKANPNNQYPSAACQNRVRP